MGEGEGAENETEFQNNVQYIPYLTGGEWGEGRGWGAAEKETEFSNKIQYIILYYIYMYIYNIHLT